MLEFSGEFLQGLLKSEALGGNVHPPQGTVQHNP